jgi:hypothetical protein
MTEYVISILDGIKSENRGDASEPSMMNQDMVSFGEFVTLMWSMDEQRKAGVLMNDGPEVVK